MQRLTRAFSRAHARTQIGYPTSPNTTDPSALERYYAPNLPVDAGDFFGNALRSVVADERRKWVSVGRPKDRGAWEMVPSEVNAYFRACAVRRSVVLRLCGRES